MRNLSSIALGLVLSAAAATAGNAAAEMRCSHQLPPAHHLAKVIDKWAAEVESASDGEIDVQVFGANSLVGARENIVSTAKGDIECAFSINAQWGKTLPIMNVTMAPFAFSDLDIWRKWPESEPAAYLTEKLREKGVQNVVWMFITNSSVLTTNGKYLIKPEDFDGVKIRGLEPSFNASLEALGAAPSSMSGSKVYQALATGVIDAGLTDVSAAVSRKYYEVQDHFTVMPLMSVYFHGYVNPKWYDGLSDKAKAALDDAGKKAAGWALEASVAAAQESPDQLREKGSNVHIATDAEIEVLEAIMRPAFDENFKGNEDAAQLIELIGKM